MIKYNEVFLAGGCLWGVKEFLRYLPGIIDSEAGRANGTSQTTVSRYDGYSECVRTRFDSNLQSVTRLMHYFFEIIDPYSINQQGNDVGEKYRTGVYSRNSDHLLEACNFINARADRASIKVEVLPLSNFVSSDSEHQDRLLRCPDDYCHLNQLLLYKYRR
jgi:peptide-methionine (S)-S-oxide reductase